MTRDEMLLRFGYYQGIADRLLGDNSYAERWRGRAHEMTEADYFRVTAQIQARLAAAGWISPDEDPFELGR